MLSKEQFNNLSYDKKLEIVVDIYSNFSNSEWFFKDLYDLLVAMGEDISEFLLNQMYALVYDLLQEKNLKFKEKEKEKIEKIKNKLEKLKQEELSEKENADDILEKI